MANQISLGNTYEKFFERIFLTGHHRIDDDSNEECNCNASAPPEFGACTSGR